MLVVDNYCGFVDRKIKMKPYSFYYCSRTWLCTYEKFKKKIKNILLIFVKSCFFMLSLNSLNIYIHWFGYVHNLQKCRKYNLNNLILYYYTILKKIQLAYGAWFTFWLVQTNGQNEVSVAHRHHDPKSNFWGNSPKITSIHTSVEALFFKVSTCFLMSKNHLKSHIKPLQTLILPSFHRSRAKIFYFIQNNIE